jgi:hypothetical protein
MGQTLKKQCHTKVTFCLETCGSIIGEVSLYC